jgi:hypothetical protein
VRSQKNELNLDFTNTSVLAYEAMLLNEFGVSNDNTWEPGSPSMYESDPIRGGDILDQYNIKSRLWIDVLVLAVGIVLARIIAYCGLRWISKPKS